MENDVVNNTGHFIYPGAFVPMQKKEEVPTASINSYTAESSKEEAVTITEMKNLYKVEVAIPDVRREDFLLYADENILTVCLVHRDRGLDKNISFPLQQSNYECFNRTIVLPENADAEFTSAEYKAGILHLYVYKAKQPVKNLHTRIVVY
jgi:HSP20 family protein